MEKNLIVNKKPLSNVVCEFEIYEPLIAASAKAGQFIILRYGELGERVPVTLVDWDNQKGTITAIIQSIGKSTAMFNSLPHSREPAVVAQFLDRRRDDAEVFRDDGQLAHALLERVEELAVGALDPLAVDGGRLAAGNLPVGLEAAEVVDAHDVHQVEHAFQARCIIWRNNSS